MALRMRRKHRITISSNLNTMKNLYLFILIFGLLFSGCENDTPETTIYTIALTDDGNGTAKATVGDKEIIKAAEGVTVVLTAVPDEGYVFGEWTTENGNVTFNNAGAASTTFTMPAGDVEIRAEFIEDNIDVLSMITDPLFKGICEYAMTNEYNYWNYLYGIDPFIHPAWDTNSDGILSLSEAYAVKAIYVVGQLIRSFEGIEYFRNLEVFACGDTGLTSLDVSHNTSLITLVCINCSLPSLDVSNNKALMCLDCNDNLITSLDVSKNTELQTLDCSKNKLSSLDISNNTKLVRLTCFYNYQLTSLDISECTALSALDCGGNHLTSLNVSNNTALVDLNCYNNQLTSLDISNNTALTYLTCFNNRMSALDITNMATSSDFFLYVVCCGDQTTDGTTPLTLTLTMREDQKPYWDFFLNNPKGYGQYNTNVILAN